MVALKDSRRKSRRLSELKILKDESRVRDRFRELVIEEQELRRMSQTTGIVDVDLLRTLFDAGFREDSIDALQLLPIAKVSWASGSVTPEESKRAIKAIDWSHAIGNPKAIDLFTDWLDRQPGEEYWSYWEGYLEARALNEDPRLFRAEGFALLRCAERVAVASGGLFGIGTICAEERECLERIRLNYLLPNSSPTEQ